MFQIKSGSGQSAPFFTIDRGDEHPKEGTEYENHILYGWDILLRGTLWPGPVIGKRCPGPIRRAAAAGHEIGLHAWDHHRWQMRLERMDQPAIAADIRKGYELLTDILGKAPDCFAAPAWKVTPEALSALEQFPFRFESDCRGRSLFSPVIDNRRYHHAQVPTTLPTYDELVGRQCTPETYNDHLLTLIRPDQLNVLTIHAEVEGGSCLGLFQDFLTRAEQRGITFSALGDIHAQAGKTEESEMDRGAVAGRDGWLACQAGIMPASNGHNKVHSKVS